MRGVERRALGDEVAGMQRVWRKGNGSTTLEAVRGVRE